LNQPIIKHRGMIQAISIIYLPGEYSAAIVRIIIVNNLDFKGNLQCWQEMS
jgi:hypothetical protein